MDFGSGHAVIEPPKVEPDKQVAAEMNPCRRYMAAALKVKKVIGRGPAP